MSNSPQVYVSLIFKSIVLKIRHFSCFVSELKITQITQNEVQTITLSSYLYDAAQNWKCP